MHELEVMYQNKCKAYVHFMFSQQQWSGISKDDLEEWLENFRDLELHEKSLVYKLLVHIIYYSEKDVVEALNEGIHNCLFYDVILNKQKENKFSLSEQALFNFTKAELKNTRFIPLLDADAPHESGNYVTRLMVQQGLIDSAQSMFLYYIPIAFKTKSFSNLVIVDDCIGSGDQLRQFWNRAKVSDEGEFVLLKDFCAEKGIKVYYMTLVGYATSIEKLQKELNNFKICCVRTLDDNQRVFQDNSYVWKNENELNQAKVLFQELAESANIPFLGYKGLDFAFIMHQTIPDWSLPLFWKKNHNWNCLLRRKNSHE